MASKRRKLAPIIYEPIDTLCGDRRLGSVVLIENDRKAALQTRAAALMHIHRCDMDLTTSVKDNEIWIMKDKDYPGKSEVIDLRTVLAN